MTTDEPDRPDVDDPGDVAKRDAHDATFAVMNALRAEGRLIIGHVGATSLPGGAGRRDPPPSTD